MSSTPLFLITDTSVIASLHKYAAMQSLRGKGLMETARRVFAFLVSFALAKIPAGDPQKIRAHLMQIVVQSRRLSAWTGASSSLRTRRARRAADELRGTLAARLVRVLNYLGGRHVRGPAFYKLVRKFIAGRIYSARLHRAGLLPALSRSKARSAGRLPKFRHTPGSYDESLSNEVVTILAENWASAHGPNAKGIVGLAGFAFDQALPEVDRLLASYLRKEMEKTAAAAGFRVTS